MKRTCFYILPFLLCFLLLSCGQQKPKALRTGDKVPDFSAVDMDGKNISLSALKGKPVIMRFWSTECKYCRADTPVFNTYYDRYKDQGLHIYYINTAQTSEQIKAFMKELQITFPVIKDVGLSIAKSYKIAIQPITIVLSPEHTLLAAIYGGVSGAEFNELLGPFLKITE